MPDRFTPARTLDRITADALSLRRALRARPVTHAHTLAVRITDAQQLAGTALRLFLDFAQHASQPSPTDLLLLDRVAQIARAAQDASAELTAALARAVENRRRHVGTASGRVVLSGPSPQQYIDSAVDLLDRIPALSDAISRDQQLTPDR
ncbi:hypothetical protein [Streptomyces sp. TP-A0356]|uniref:hypothetical protein n=1 Tax=Streptomyces sp. TP-A0356 TaxID=1359208 RepID=UPI0006E19164|nr:hypothetical protein [Streptomyces sp. TP-A0356]